MRERRTSTCAGPKGPEPRLSHIPAIGGHRSRVSKPQPGGQGQGPARDRLRPSVENFQSPTLVPPARDRLPASVRRSPSSQKIFSVQVGGRRRSVAGLEAPAGRAGARARDRPTPRIRPSVRVEPKNQNLPPFSCGNFFIGFFPHFPLGNGQCWYGKERVDGKLFPVTLLFTAKPNDFLPAFFHSMISDAVFAPRALPIV